MYCTLYWAHGCSVYTINGLALHAVKMIPAHNITCMYIIVAVMIPQANFKMGLSTLSALSLSMSHML